MVAVVGMSRAAFDSGNQRNPPGGARQRTRMERLEIPSECPYHGWRKRGCPVVLLRLKLPSLRPTQEKSLMEPNMIGAYGPWAAGLVGDGPARLSFRDKRVPPAELDAWRTARVNGCVMPYSNRRPARLPGLSFNISSTLTACTSST